MRPLKDAQPVYLTNGRAATRGVCPECGTALTRLGATPAHEGLPKPEPQPAAERTPKQAAKQATKKPAKATSAAPKDKASAGKGTGSKTKDKDAAAARGKGGPRRTFRAAPIRPGAKLVIVESPAKARTVGRFLGHEYDVRASIGHVRDLLRSQLSVDIDNDFAPKYRVPDEKKEVVKELKSAAASAGQVFLATDPDREGEAIAWHLLEAAEIPPERAQRVVFHEITKNAIADAFGHARDIDMRLVDAQQARRILDRLVGYQISPLLWDRVKSRLSAGRVQSVALRLIVEREREILAFVPVEYWSLDAELAQQTTRGQAPRPSFLARLIRIRGQEADLKNREDTLAIVAELEGATYRVANLKLGERRRRPYPPFTTSTLQQDASAKLGMAAARTMRVAQDLYEGIDIGEGGGPVGLITYMRTDSVNVAQEAQAEARSLIAEQFGPEYLPPEPNVYKARAKNAQEAHEAIRPTSVRRQPSALRDKLSPEQYRLYDLIWRRFMASQMAAAIYDTITVDVDAGKPGTAERPYLFRASGSTVRFPGWLAVYAGGASGPAESAAGGDNGKEPRGQAGSAAGGENGRDADASREGDGDAAGPASGPPRTLTEGELLDLLQLLPEQHFTQPPPRYTEASLVKALEEYGIGRPSTYAAIISTILERGYVERSERKLVPTDLGFTVNDLLVKHFDRVFNVGFTAEMEEHLDSISRGEEEMAPVLRDFYGFFGPQLRNAEATMEKVTLEPEKIGEACPTCGGDLVLKQGRFGRFIGCSNYPACRYTRPLIAKVGVACPKDGGELVERRTKTGRVFYGCSNYPQCEFSSWKKPLPEKCPHCGGMLVQASKDTAECTVCGKRTGVKAVAG
jgi:DNA topoisomerase I